LCGLVFEIIIIGMVYNNILKNLEQKKLFALLIDPEPYTRGKLLQVISIANNTGVDYILVGGSFVPSLEKFEDTLQLVRSHSDIPVLIFPGNYLQVSDKAQGILLLNLISGRNPDYLIGQHVLASRAIQKSGIEVMPTGYILVENGKATSVEYVSNTRPIPANKHEIIISTALAGEQMGNKLIYLEAGSGAINTVSADIVKKVKSNIQIPLIVGGGIACPETVELLFNAGADMVVVGNAIEKDPELLHRIKEHKAVFSKE
jgi:phosphoglycerol geranylgeranyltransferase